jgi:small-conductance mechanosensitive channel
VGLAVIALVVGLLVHWVLYRGAALVAGRTSTRLHGSIVDHTSGPARLLIVLAALLVASVFMTEEARSITRQLVLFLGVLGLGWLLVSLTLVGEDAVMRRFPEGEDDSLEARQARTQLSVLQRFGAIIIWLVALALALLTIPGVAPLAASLLAGAGVLGIVLGVAAGPTIGNFIAGVQIALTQPIKLGDVVVIDGEWGRIGEITSTYVVVYIWDKRRLVVPFSRIVNQPVENWTRRTTDLLATVKIFADYRAPVDAIRNEVKRILDASGMWDGEAWSVLVTAADDRTITIRALFSAPDSGNAWELQCLVREQLISFLQEHHPEALPVAREIQQTAS